MTGRAIMVVAVVAACLTLVGCGRAGLNSLALPGTAGRGSDAIQVDVIMPDVSTITENSPVLVDDVTVGSISRIVTDGWNARVTVSLDATVRLPENATAKIGQTSLLGSQHVALAAPTDEAPTGILRGGATIPLERASVFPTTEQTLSSLSVVLNGGGVDQIHGITSELNKALDSNVGNTRDLVGQVDRLVGTLDDQRDNIVSALEGLDRMTGTFADQQKVLSAALDALPVALSVLAEDRENITGAVQSSSRLGAAANDLVETSKQDLIADLSNLSTVLKNIADSGQDLIASLPVVTTFPFPQAAIDSAIKGDYTNLFLVLDLTVERLRSGLLAGTPLGPAAIGPEAMIGQPSPTTSSVPTDPFAGPLGGLSAALQAIPGIPDIPGLPTGPVAPTAPASPNETGRP